MKEDTAVSAELVGVAEIAAEFGVPRTTVSMWAARRATSGFPLPVASPSMGPVYDMAEIRKWRQGKKDS